MLRIIAAACALACAIVTTAEAGPRDWPLSASNAPDGKAVYGRPFKADVRGPLQPQMFTRKKQPQTVDVFSRSNPVVRAAAEILPHPAGCPRRAFCGCGAAIKVFGQSVRHLWLARNWFAFPRAAPGPGMAEVRRNHVRIIEADMGGGRYQFYDANSGRGLTRRHVDVIRGTIVNPQG